MQNKIYETLKNLNIDFMIFFDRFRNPFYAFFVDNEDKLTPSQKLFILKLKTKYYKFLSSGKKLKRLKTIDKINNQLYMLTFQPIIRNIEDNFAYGSLCFGKKISIDYFKYIEKLTCTIIKFDNDRTYERKTPIIRDTTGIIQIYNVFNQLVATIKIIFKKNLEYEITKRLILLIIIFIVLGIFLFFKKRSKLIELDMLEELKLLNKAIDQSKTGIMITEFDGTIFYINEIISKVTGYSKEELYGKKSSILMDENLLLKIFETDLKVKGFWHGEITGRKKNGEEIPLEINISAVFDDNGKVKCFITTCEFLSEKKKLINELQQAKNELEKMAKFKASLLANLSHEIKTPLTGIMGFIDLLAETELNETQKYYIKLLKESSERLYKLFSNFIEFAKLEAKLHKVELKPFSLKEMNNIIVTQFKKRCEEKGLKFFYEYDENIPDIVIGNEEIVYNILNLLLDNAVKFTEKGEVNFICKLKNLIENNIIIDFIIEDTGIGMDWEEMEKSMELFSQVDSSLTRKYEGIGIGLPLVKSYLHAIDGQINIESKKGKGTKITITLIFKKHLK